MFTGRKEKILISSLLLLLIVMLCARLYTDKSKQSVFDLMGSRYAVWADNYESYVPMEVTCQKKTILGSADVVKLTQKDDIREVFDAVSEMKVVRKHKGSAESSNETYVIFIMPNGAYYQFAFCDNYIIKQAADGTQEFYELEGTESLMKMTFYQK